MLIIANIIREPPLVVAKVYLLQCQLYQTSSNPMFFVLVPPRRREKRGKIHSICGPRDTGGAGRGAHGASVACKSDCFAVEIKPEAFLAPGHPPVGSEGRRTKDELASEFVVPFLH